MSNVDNDKPRYIECVYEATIEFDLEELEIAWERVENVEDVLKEGQEIEVKLIDIDERSGKLKLSRKVLLPRPEKK